jgi:hypothetical protein
MQWKDDRPPRWGFWETSTDPHQARNSLAVKEIKFRESESLDKTWVNEVTSVRA